MSTYDFLQRAFSSFCPKNKRQAEYSPNSESQDRSPDGHILLRVGTEAEMMVHVELRERGQEAVR